MEPEPEDKDWTWVLERPCDECGLDVGRIDPASVPSLVRTDAAAWIALLDGDPQWLRARPQPQVWSPLEYACHVRDSLRLFDVRLKLMLAQDDPLFANWDQDATAVEQHYGDSEPATVSREIRAAADVIAASFEGVTGPEWSRTGRRSDGASFTVESFARYFIHDPMHHLWDVTGSATGR